MHLALQLHNEIAQLLTWHNLPTDPATWRLVIRAAFTLARR
jgi:hypothetical protein